MGTRPTGMLSVTPKGAISAAMRSATASCGGPGLSGATGPGVRRSRGAATAGWPEGQQLEASSDGDWRCSGDSGGGWRGSSRKRGLGRRLEVSRVVSSGSQCEHSSRSGAAESRRLGRRLVWSSGGGSSGRQSIPRRRSELRGAAARPETEEDGPGGAATVDPGWRSPGSAAAADPGLGCGGGGSGLGGGGGSLGRWGEKQRRRSSDALAVAA